MHRGHTLDPEREKRNSMSFTVDRLGDSHRLILLCTHSGLDTTAQVSAEFIKRLGNLFQHDQVLLQAQMLRESVNRLQTLIRLSSL